MSQVRGERAAAVERPATDRGAREGVHLLTATKLGESTDIRPRHRIEEGHSSSGSPLLFTHTLQGDNARYRRFSLLQSLLVITPLTRSTDSDDIYHRPFSHLCFASTDISYQQHYQGQKRKLCLNACLVYSTCNV